MSQKTRTPRVTIRLTKEEKDQLETAASSMTLSAYIRACMFDGDGDISKYRGRRRQPVKDDKAIAQLLGILGQSRMANNLNQLAKAVNMGTLPVNSDTKKDIAEACNHIAQMRMMLISALGLQNGDRS